MQSLYDVPAPAKLNTFLHIVGRRPDGYHLIQSVFVLIDWADKLHFSKRGDGLITREDLTWELPADDLCLRAARALQQASSCTLGVHIGLEKSVPAQAGMGGGSSDAASTLLALNQLWDLHWPLSRLLPIGLSLGADVPFFLGGHNAWVEGIGEKMTPVELPRGRFVMVKPDQGLETARIFSDPELKRDSEPAIITGFAVNAFENIYEYGRNDLQAVAQKLCPGVNLALEWLHSMGLQGRMTGSGSAVFAQALHEVDVKTAPANFQVKTCSSMDVHPLWGWAPSDGLSVGSF